MSSIRWVPTSRYWLGVLPAGLLACVTPALPPGPDASKVAEQTARRVEALYLWPERIDDRVLHGALEAFEQRFDPVRFEHNGTRGELRVGDERVTVSNLPDLEPEAFVRTLGSAVEFVRVRLGPDLEEDLAEEETLELLALRGALGALDRHSTIFSGKGTDDFQIRFSGQLQGIGSRIGRRDGDLIAVRVFPDSPAERAGLQDGDAIVEINGEPTRPMTVAEAVTKIRGPARSVVVLTARREEEKLEIPITRGKVTVPTVETEELEPGIGYARIFQISRSTPKEFERKVSELGELEGLVLDLRSNSGGSMLASAQLADLFLASGTIVRTVGRGGKDVQGLRSVASATADVKFQKPIVVLVDGATASAAEILAGAIQPLPHVTLVGQETFGKGVVQRIYRLPEDNLLKLTVAEYLLSNDRAIHEQGIEPDVVLFPASSERVAPLAGAPDEALPYLRTAGEDDRFPIEVGQAMLGRGHEAGLAEVRADAETKIRERLAELGVEWSEESPEPLEGAGENLEIRVEAPPLEAGRPAELRLTVRNRNPFPIPNAWATIDGPLSELAGRALALGTLPANGQTSATVEVEPPDGLAAGQLGVEVRVASRLHPVQTRKVILRAREHVPDLEIEVQRESDQARVWIRNRGDTGAGELRIDIPGAFRVFEDLAPGAEEELELPIAGKASSIILRLFGPSAERRVLIPLPEDRSKVIPPRVRLTRGGLLALGGIRLEASDPSGLREGWISLDGEKKAYTRWKGSPSGSLRVRMTDEEHAFLSKVETLDGVAVVDIRTLTAD